MLIIKARCLDHQQVCLQGKLCVPAALHEGLHAANQHMSYSMLICKLVFFVMTSFVPIARPIFMLIALGQGLRFNGQFCTLLVRCLIPCKGTQQMCKGLLQGALSRCARGCGKGLL